MSRVLDTDKLIATIRRRAMIPDDSSVFTDADLIDILNEEIDVGLLSTLLSLNEEHLVTFEDEETQVGQTEYFIPYRAIGNKLRDVAYVDSTNAVYELSRTSLEELSDYNYYSNSSSQGLFYVKNNTIVLVNTTLSDYKFLRKWFYLRPNNLVDTNRVGVISSIDRSTGIIGISNFPDNFTTIPDMDFVGKRSPNKIFSYDKTPASVDKNTKSVTFATTDIPAELSVGDYLCQAEESPVPNIPTEMHPVLAERVAVHVLESLGDTEGLANAEKRLAKMETAIMQLIDDRVEGSPQKIRARHTPLKSAISRSSKYRNR